MSLSEFGIKVTQAHKVNNSLMPMVGLENGSGNEDQREQINKARESLMIRGYEIKSWMAGWKGRKEGKKHIREYIGEWWRMA